MKLNRRGDIGFPEAMMAVMIVTIVLTAYLAAFATGVVDRTENAPAFDRRVTEDARVSEGRIVLGTEGRMESFVDKADCNGLTVRCTVPGHKTIEPLDAVAGTADGKVSGERYTQLLRSDDGRVYSAVFEVGVWY